jgi:hypothetical protein
MAPAGRRAGQPRAELTEQLAHQPDTAHPWPPTSAITDFMTTPNALGPEPPDVSTCFFTIVRSSSSDSCLGRYDIVMSYSCCSRVAMSSRPPERAASTDSLRRLA